MNTKIIAVDRVPQGNVQHSIREIRDLYSSETKQKIKEGLINVDNYIQAIEQHEDYRKAKEFLLDLVTDEATHYLIHRNAHASSTDADTFMQHSQNIALYLMHGLLNMEQYQQGQDLDSALPYYCWITPSCI